MNSEVLLNASWLIMGCHMAINGKDEVLVLSSQGPDLLKARVEMKSHDIHLGGMDAPFAAAAATTTLLIVEMKKASLVQSSGTWHDALVLPKERG